MARLDAPDSDSTDLKSPIKEDQSTSLDLVALHFDFRPQAVTNGSLTDNQAKTGETLRPQSNRNLMLPDILLHDDSDRAFRGTGGAGDAATKAPADATIKAPADAVAKAQAAGAIEYRPSSEYRQNPDDPSTIVKIEKDASGKHVRVTDANRAASTYVTNGESQSPQGSNVESATINSRNYKGEIENAGEIKDGVLHWKDASGQEHHDRIQSAVLTPTGDLHVQFPDGSKRIYEASGARVDFDNKGRPTSMVDANGNVYKYENYSIPGIGINYLLGGREYPEKVTVYNPETKKSYEFRREGQLGSAAPYYKVYVEGLPLSGEMTLTAGAGANFGNVSAGVGLSIPVDKVCQLEVQPNGGIKIHNEKTGWVYNDVSEVTRNPNGSSVVDDWKYETTTCIWWGQNVQRILRSGMPANVANVPR